jgi:4-carboxymuconolactone decarboxylase
VHSRRARDPRTREAVALAARLTPAEINEIVLQAAAFAGFPRAVTAAGRLLDLLDAPAPATTGLPAGQVSALRSLVAAGHQRHVLTTRPGTAVTPVPG